MMKRLSEQEALARLQRAKAEYKSYIKKHYEHKAQSCAECATPGVCCADAHFVNVHITRLEAVAIRETLRRTPRLNEAQKRAVYERAQATVERYNLRAAGDTFAQTYSCPLFIKNIGCLVHARAKPAPCIQHACYENWTDMPPINLQWRAEHRIERLNAEVYDAAWAWLPIPLWLTLIDPASDGRELEQLARAWSAQKSCNKSAERKQQTKRRQLPVLR
jgi:hypothetical protein